MVTKRAKYAAGITAAAFILTLIAGILPQFQSEPALIRSAAAADAQESAGAGATAPAWNVNHEQSKLDFVDNYAGTQFDGRFRKFDADIRFDPDALAQSAFDVNIDITSVTVFNDEWDSVLVGREWFYFSKYPKSRFVTHSFRKTGDNQYAAMGMLELKGKKHDVELDFTWEPQADGSARVHGETRLLGEAKVNRTDFGIGDGQYATDSNIGFEVQVKVDLLLTPAG